MGDDEMGNSNVTGLQGSATEQDNTEVMNESSNSWVMSNNVDGLKGVTDDLADGKQATERHDSEDVAISKSPKALIMSNNVNDSKSESHLDFSVEFSNLHEKHMASAHEDKSAAADNLIQKQTPERREEEEIKSSLDALSRNEETSSISSVDLSNNEQVEPTSMTCNESSANDIMEQRDSNLIATDEEEIKSSLDTLSRNGETLSVSSVDPNNNEQEEPTSITCKESSAEDIMEQMDSNLITKKEEQIKSSLDILSRNGETLSMSSVDLKNNEQEEPTSVTCNESSAEDILEERATNENSAGSDGKCDESGNERGGVNKITVIKSNPTIEKNMKEAPADECGSSGDRVLINSNVIEQKNEENGGHQLPEFDVVANESTTMQQKNSLSTESIKRVYFDATDSEIRSLIMEDDPEEVEKSSQINPNKNDMSLNLNSNDDYRRTLERKIMKDDIKGESIEFQLKAIDPSQEEMQESKDGRLEDSKFEQAAQIDKTKSIERTQEKQQDYQSSLVSEEQNGHSAGEMKMVEAGTTVLIVDNPVADNKHEENKEDANEGSYKENKLEDNKIHEKGPSELSSYLSYPVPILSKEVEIKPEDQNQTQKNAQEITVKCEDSDNETKVFKDNDINKKRFSILSSNLLDPLDTAYTEMIEEMEAGKTAGEESKHLVDDQIKNMPDATMSEEYVYEINLKETRAPPAPLTEPSDTKNNLIQPHLVSPDCLQEFEWKQIREECETESKIYSLTNVGQCLDICSGLPNQTDRTTVMVFELENEEKIPCEINPSLSQMRTQENEVSKVEYSESDVNFAVQSQNDEQECNSKDHAAVRVSVSDLKVPESSGRFATESNQEKLNGWTDEIAEAGYCLEISIVESESAISAAQSQKGESEEIPLFPPPERVKCLTDLSESCEYEAHRNSEQNISTLGVKTEVYKQNSSLCPDKTATADILVLERSVTETDENSTRYQTTTTQEIISRIGAGTTVSIIEARSEESDKAPLLSHKKPMERALPALERGDSRKLKTPLLSLIKEEACVVKSLGKKVLKNDTDEAWQSPAKKFEATSPRGRGKQKPRSSLFSNCMCCTTAIN